MKEQDLIELNFERVDVTEEESGGNSYYYYTWDPFPLSHFSLITKANDEVENDNWVVNIFGDERNIVFTNKDDIENLIKIIKSNITSKMI